MKFKTSILIMLLFLSASHLSWGIIDAHWIQSISSNKKTFTHKTINRPSWKRSDYKISPASVDDGTVTSRVIVNASEIGLRAGHRIGDTNQIPALAINKTADPPTYDQPGQVINYTYLISNPGDVSLNGPITVSDDKTTNESCPSVNSVGNHDKYLDPGEVLSCSASYTITQDDLNTGSVTNVATAYADGITSPPDTATVTAVQQPALSLTKDADPLTYDHLSQLISYTYLVSNNGNQRVLGPVTIDDDQSGDETCPAVSSVGNGDDYLDPGENLTCTASYTITQDDLNAGSVINVASASAGGITSPTDSVTVTAIQRPALTILKTADPLIYDQPGQVISYTYLVTNTGNVTITAPFNLYDDKTNDEACPPSPTSLNPGQSITCTSSYTIQPEDIIGGSVTNSANATGRFKANTIISNTVIITINALHRVNNIFLPMVSMSKPGIWILPNSYPYVSHDTQYIIGEILNNTNSNLAWVDVVVNFFNTSDQQVGTSHTYLWPIYLPAWQRSCFKISTDITNWSYYQFETSTYNMEASSPNLAILNASGAYNSVNGNYQINGQVRNNGSQVSMNVAVSGTVYNDSGVPVSCAYNSVDQTNLNPGQTGDFTIDFYGFYRDYADVTSYRLRVAGELP
jgi:uncharacterized repeat protein (TIGR01451 family)